MKLTGWALMILSGAFGLASRMFAGGGTDCPSSCSQWLPWDRAGCEACRLMSGFIGSAFQLAFWTCIGISAVFMLLAWWQYSKR